MITYILAAIIGFFIALLGGKYRSSRENQKIDELTKSIDMKKGKLDEAQKEADKALEDYLKSLGDIDDSGGGHA